jgi:2,3-bisphosphoglycerate-independent phosphoglycerate mutase
MEPSRKVLLVIMDGWGIGRVASADAIRNAHTPFTNALYDRYPHTTLVTCGEAVGLPEGQMGNSEVGHLNLGAGRIVYQELQRIHVAIRDGSFASNKTLLEALQHAKKEQKTLHLLGLVSDGGVHAHLSHLKAILDRCHAEGLRDVCVHAFTDGRDCDPKSGIGFLRDLQEHMDRTTGRIATVCGRYFAMDRDKRWDRVKKAYDALVLGQGVFTTDAVEATERSYAAQVTDEFILPIVVRDTHGSPLGLIRDGDVAICFNFRTDRCREITQVLTQTDLPEHNMRKLDLHYTTMTEYDSRFRNVHVIFENDHLTRTLGEVIAEQGCRQLRAAETEKYPHVTFFFSGGREEPFPGEARILIPSPKVATYDLQPEMSAPILTDAVVKELRERSFHFGVLNYANADMVGHTGVWEAAIRAVETVDHCVEQVVTAALQNDYAVFLTADHGNSDYMINPDGTPNTAHTLNPVPLFVISKDWNGSLQTGKLGDIAPSVLTFMGLPVPKEMTGKVLFTET